MKRYDLDSDSRDGVFEAPEGEWVRHSDVEARESYWRDQLVEAGRNAADGAQKVRDEAYAMNERLTNEREAEYERGRKEEGRLATVRCREIVAKVEARYAAEAAEVHAHTLRQDARETALEAERDALAADNARLRAALNAIAALPEHEHYRMQVERIAREALGAK